MSDNQRFQILLRAKGLTYAEIASQVGLSDVQVRHIFSGKHLPRVDKALGIAAALNVRVDDLWQPWAA